MVSNMHNFYVHQFIAVDADWGASELHAANYEAYMTLQSMLSPIYTKVSVCLLLPVRSAIIVPL